VIGPCYAGGVGWGEGMGSVSPVVFQVANLYY